MKTLALSAVAIFMTTAASFATPAPVTTVSTGIGDVLAGENGMTLYTFKKDEPGVTNCYDKCAVNWPPLLAKEGDTADAPYSLVERTDGTKQWAKDGMPLYFWIKDEKKGDTSGDKVGDVWDVARP